MVYNPIEILTSARKAVPAVDYALGLTGVAAAGAIILAMTGSGRAATIVAGAVLVGMLLLFVFASLVKAQAPAASFAGVVLMWAVVLFFIIFLGMTVSAVALGIPCNWADILGIRDVCQVSPPPTAAIDPPEPEPTPDNGWAWAGYLDKTDAQVWATGPFVDVASYSGSSDRPYPIREGDVVRPRKDLPQVIVGYASTKEQNVLEPPPRLTGTIVSKRDYTGEMYEPSKTYLVNDVEVWQLPGSDQVVWLRLTPGEPDPVRTDPPDPKVTTSVIYQVCVGQYERGCASHNAYLPCYEDVNRWAANQCQALSGEVSAVAKVSDRGGNMCGYAQFTVMCSVTR